jgi:hypothetical protein
VILIDEELATVVNTLESNVTAFNTCSITTGSSRLLMDAEHTVRVVNNRTMDATNITPIAIYFISFESVTSHGLSFPWTIAED